MVRGTTSTTLPQLAGSGPIGLELRHVGEAGIEAGVKALVELGAGSGKEVVHPQPCFSRYDESGPAQIAEVARDRGLWELKNFNEITDTELLFPDQVKNSQPRAV